ncbi:hypothetical protein, partial [Intrasporangium sp.]|uniref:prealbumin-like fold domain-containing protein n=1 Tax=Intrasporangium sp. TaxID=1925024 RepID=UPI003365509B
MNDNHHIPTDLTRRGRPPTGGRRVRTAVLVVITLIASLAMQFGVGTAARADTFSPTISTDLADYNPGQTVTLTGAGWDPAGPKVHIFVNDDVGQVWFDTEDVAPDGSGAFVHQFTLPNQFVAKYFVVATQTYPDGTTLTANTSFTDANPAANIDQCANDPAPSPNTDGCSTSATDWVNGNVVASKALYFEGDSLPYRVKLTDLSLASHTLTIQWDTTKGGKHALDYLTTFNRTVADANPCVGVSGCLPGTFSTFPIPADTQVTGAGVTPVPGVFTMYGGTITAVSAYSYPGGNGFAGDKTAQITITFDASVTNPVLAWAGHISTRADWGLSNSAVTINGSPYHTSLVDLDTKSIGSQDVQLSADAVIFPGSITVIKQATPEGDTAFGFTASPSPLSNFSLTDDGTTANTKVFSNITDFKTYTVSEDAPTGAWTFGAANCTVTSPNGGTQTVVGRVATIALKEGENVTCTYTNLKQATLTIIKHVVNDNGGTAVASNWSMHVKTGSPAAEISGSPAAGSETGTTYTVAPGTYALSETGGPANYDASNWVCTGTGNQSGSNITLALGDAAICTITNNDVAPKLHLRKVVINNNGGAKTVADFTLTADGAGTNDISGTSPVDSGAGLKADTWALSETGPSGYSASAWSCVGGTQSGS